MHPRLKLAPIVAFVIVFAGPPSPADAHQVPLQTKEQAQVHLLSILTRSWRAARMPGLVDPRTHLPADNTQAICRGIGARLAGGSYAQFVCVVRPRHHRPRQGLYIGYRVLADGRCVCHWLGYRKK